MIYYGTIYVFVKNNWVSIQPDSKLYILFFIASALLTNSLEHYRLIGYVSAFALHGVNSLVMFLELQGDILNDPQIKRFYSMQWMYMTIWNVLFQLVYAGFGIFCDLPTLLEIKEPKLIKYLKSYREVVFMGIVVPIGFMIFAIFWPIYIYDRGLVFPEFIDKVLSQWSNHVMHTAILPIICWEFIFLPKSTPKNQQWYFAHTYGVYFSYLFVLFGTYARRGMWPYPILKHTFGTILFPAIFVAISIALYMVYRGQWQLNKLLWSSNGTSKHRVK